MLTAWPTSSETSLASGLVDAPRGLVWVKRLLPLVLILVLGSCSTGPTVSALFVGNSYTTSNDLPGMVRALGDVVGRGIETQTRAPGGWWLRDHLDSADTVNAIAEDELDYIVLQEQSMVPADRSLADSVSRPAVIGLATQATGADIVMFMTWGHRNGSSEVGHSSYDSMQIAIANTYDRLAAAVIGDVAPVGAAWWMALAERPDINLYQADGSHPSQAGSYLAAVVIAATLLDLDPTEFDADLGLDGEVAGALRGFASRAVAGERPWS